VSSSFDLSAVQRLTVGTVGPVGKRTFYLQARQDDQLVTLKMEKQQVGALAQLLSEILADRPPSGPVPSDTELEELIVVDSDDEDDEDAEQEASGGMARLAATREQVAALARRGAALVEAGRPPCPLCGYPLDPEGHSCPRTNGHRPPTL
jgi:hypothetical protein